MSDARPATPAETIVLLTDALNPLIDSLCDLAEAAKITLDDELGDAAWDADCPDPQPQIAVRDAAGRGVAAIRLDREAATDRFTLVLLTQEDL